VQPSRLWNAGLLALTTATNLYSSSLLLIYSDQDTVYTGCYDYFESKDDK
jgi:hypothetical protein